MNISIQPGGQKTVLLALKVFRDDWRSITWTLGNTKDPVVVTGVTSTHAKVFSTRGMKIEEAEE
jgi:hypothetical protein